MFLKKEQIRQSYENYLNGFDTPSICQTAGNLASF